MAIVVRILIRTLWRGGIYALLASGMSLIYGVGGIVNLAHTAFFMLAAFGMLYFTRTVGLDRIPTIVVTLACVTILGILIYRFLINRIRQHHAAVLLMTIALAMAFQELLKLEFGSIWRGIRPPLVRGSTMILGQSVANDRLLVLGVTAGVILGLWLLLTKTRLGTAIRAVANDAEVANLMGISVSRTLMISMGIGTFLAALAGVLIAPIEGVVYYMWMEPLMLVLVVVVLGGLGSIKGSFIGAFIIGLVEALVLTFMPARTYLALPFALLVMIVVLAVRPGGLFGTVFEEERL